MDYALILSCFINQKQKLRKFRNKDYLKFILIIFLLFSIYKIYVFRKLILYNDKNKNKIKSNNQNYLLKQKNIKVCLCTVGKQENKYIREFVQHYEKYGINKIILYDNNDKDGEKFEEVIKDYIDKGFVQINNWRGIKQPDIRTLRDCYMNNNQSYDWLIFYDIDEYIYLKNITDIREFLNSHKFIHCDKIYLNWVMHTDNNLLKYDNRSLHERFPVFKPLKKNKKYIISGKSIIRGGIKNIHIKEVHYLDKKIRSCDSKGKIINFRKIKQIYDLDSENYFIDHYYFKSLEEFIQKIKKGDTYFGHNKIFIMHRLKRYFIFNKITLKKIKFLEKNLKVNLSKYKKYLKII